MALPKTSDCTIEDFEAFTVRPENRDRSFELIDGEIVEKAMPTEEHALIVNLFLYHLTGYAMGRKIGLPGPESRFRVPGDTKNSRRPDISMVIDPDVPVTTKGAASHTPDVIVEVKSPDDSNDDLRDRARFYIVNGAKLVWLVFPRPKIIEVYRPGVPSEMLTADDTLDGYDVLPGFSLPAGTLFISKRSGE